ncbi:MAG TPA: OmpA family protein [Bacteroidales bacterium]|nr:OmpA family protein [Bacteroidales bacterium]
MMKALKLITLVCLFSFFLNTFTIGQTEKVKYNTWSASVRVGAMNFYGDLRQFDFYPVSAQQAKDWYKITDDVSETNLGFGLSVSKQLSPTFAIQGILDKGKLGGVKHSVEAYFKGDVLNYGFNLVVNFSNLFWPSSKNNKIGFYGYAGLGFTDFKAKQYHISDNSSIYSYGYGENGQENKMVTETTVPLGLGLKYKLNNKFDIGIETSLKNVNTDKLDARVRANTAKDKYGFTCVTLTYKIGKNEKSLEWTNPKEMEADETAPLLAAINKKIDSLGQKMKDIDSKVNKVEKDLANFMNPSAEADDDSDGVPNSKDLEPNTPKGNLVNFQGITIPKATTTSPSVTTTAAAAELPLFSIFFDVNSSIITGTNEEKIVLAAKMLKDDPSLKFDLVGHADKTGGTVFNELLSKQRAQAVYNMLVKSYGIDASRLTIIAKGDTDPLSTDILSVNRRVDFVIKK